jgi:phosphonate transport system permease protein
VTERPRWLGALSLPLPGLGQAARGSPIRGLAVLAAVASALGVAIWYDHPGWYVVVALLWLWNVWDALRLPSGAPLLLATALWLVLAYGIGVQVTEIRLGALFQNTERGGQVVRLLFRPDLIAPREEVLEASVRIQIPCGEDPPRAQSTENGVTISLSPDCAGVNEMLLLSADGLWPDYPVELIWRSAIGSYRQLGGNANEQLILQSDADGHLSGAFAVPSNALIEAGIGAAPDLHMVVLTQRRAIGGYALSRNGAFVVQGIYETLALALLTTVLGAVLALPMSFLAARNLMSANPITTVIYFIVRTALNLLRSIEALIFGIIFVIIVGLGPFAGMLALTLHTIAALGKLYSEVIEGIDPGPIEAIRATGGTWVQVVRYAVIPQIVPPFIGLTIYRWDINVRSSTIIGFVGGGGIGFYLFQWINLGDYRAVSGAFIAIAIVVFVMDIFSARLREQLH